MNFTEFIGQNHPDPDSLLNAKFDQLCKLAEDYAEYKQLLQSRVVGRSEQLADFCKKVSGQKDCPAEFQEILNKEFWNLIS